MPRERVIPGGVGHDVGLDTDDRVDADAPPTPSNKLVAVCGYLYMVFTMGCSVWYINVLKPHVGNDYWWAAFNTSGAQTFLSDWSNRQLLLNQTGTRSLVDASVVMAKDYSAPATYIDVSLAAPRTVLQGKLAFEDVVPALRHNSLHWNTRLLVLYCWVDFARVFEVALTAGQQARCDRLYTANAARYLEPVLRNTDATDALQGPMAPPFQSAIFDAVSATTYGQEWLAVTLSGRWLTELNEAAFWRAHNTSVWQSSISNYYQQGLEESIVVVNALGLQQTIRIAQVPLAFRGLSLWTMVNAYIGMWNFVWSTLDGATPLSLVRSAPNNIDAMNQTANFFYIAKATAPPVTAAVVNTIGPLGDMDITLVPIPAPLAAYASALRATLYDTISADASAFTALYDSVPAVAQVYPTPEAWNLPGARFVSGNIMCVSATTTTSFAQESFGFYDACGRETPLTVALEREHAVLAALAAAPPSATAVCALSSTDSHAACMQTLTPALMAATALASPAGRASAVASTAPLNVSLLQVISPATLVSQALLPATPNTAWEFFGWIMLFEWLEGLREVYAFVSDDRTVVVMSRRASPTPVSANPLELPASACQYVWAITLYVTLVINVVMVLMVLVGLRAPFQVCGYDLFKCNRVVGCTWIGRPFLFVRGVTALALFATARVDFVARGGLSRLVAEPRSLLQTMLVAGEGTWITYVVSDFFLPFTAEGANYSAPVSSFLAWLAMVLLESFAPYEATVTLDRRCTVQMVGLQASCASGRVDIGSLPRLLFLLGLNTAIVVGSLVVVGAYQHCVARLLAEPRRRKTHLLIPAASEGYLVHTHARHWYMDQVICVMSGMLPVSAGAVLDIKLWLIFRIQSVYTAQSTAKTTGIGSRAVMAPVDPVTASPPVPAYKASMRLKAGLGLLYMAVSVFTSYSFLYLSQFAMGNDFWWAYFNATGTQTYLTNWFTTNLQLLTPVADTARSLDDAAYFDASNLYNSSKTVAHVPVLYANMIQDEINALANVVAGLRAMDGCLLPWIATSYCFVDWGQTWSLAPTAALEVSCRRQKPNAAVYLASALRNAAWPSLTKCWGSALQVGVFATLATTRTGQQWITELEATVAAPPTVAAEVALWISTGLTTYTTQWQNYKALGVIETFGIHSAFGLEYALTLKSSNATLRLGTQTSYKMFTPLAFALELVRNNRSSLAGASLVRGSPSFGFANMTPAAVMAQNGTLPSPLGVGLALFESVVGPFGEVALRRVPCPASVKQWYEATWATLMVLITTNATTLETFATTLQSPNQYTPTAWPQATGYYGGNLLCNTQSSASTTSLTYFTIEGSCMPNMNDLLGVNAVAALQATLALGLSSASVVAIEAIGELAVDAGKTAALLTAATAFLEAFLPQDNRTSLLALAATAQYAVATTHNVSYAQYVTFNDTVNGTATTGPMVLVTTNFFPSGPLEYFSWLYLAEWVQGIREVVTFEGTVGTLTTISGRNAVATAPVNGMEIPVNVAVYFQRVVQYITVVLAFVAILTCLYILSSRGYIEAANLLVVNRVAGLVWIGRPLLFLRSMTAICLLSTAGLQLVQLDGYFRFQAVQTPWYTTITASGELTWLAFILNDAFSLVTLQYTPGYSSKSTLMVWAASAVWSFASPVVHTVHLARRCDVAAVDFQAICTAGYVAIGSVDRFLALNALTCGLVLMLYVLERLRHRHLPPAEDSSFFLYAAANYQFKKARWQHHGTYCIDKASAAINGLVSFEYDDRITLLDIKMWRRHTVSIARERREARNDPNLRHLLYAIPMKS
ncbi:hypothetical protein ACHHYP_03752 [Achlya hypogyna]|uniref:Uncharacterized protein n=1 Tax=Achlya hypogyna TaxID=1202772 RepID=A0A1V9Z333_ACHHY|nr:hypothetical protein ACHHYP_03752 [Achlya hypogyna]